MEPRMSHGRTSKVVRAADATLEVYIEGTGPSLVILPSYGRDGGIDYDIFARKVSAAGFTILRPQPRGIAGSKGRMIGLTLHDLATDIAFVIRELGGGSAVVLGHAFGNGVARMLATDHPSVVQGVILAAAQCSAVPADVAETPHQACDLNASVEQRLSALKKGFFAPGHDANLWLEGWYPETMQMQVKSAARVRSATYWTAGLAPILEIIPEADPFKPREYWNELRDQLGNRVETEFVADASHALFPEQPDKVSELVISWCRRFTSNGLRQRSRP
jgi:pimeloyl-ACP methyl ester carboxylesterase